MLTSYTGATPESSLVRLMRIWERLGSWQEQELFLQMGDDLCEIGRYLAVNKWHAQIIQHPTKGGETEDQHG